MAAEVWTQIATELDRLLRPAGFTKRGKRFADETAPGVVKVIEIERFRWNTPDRKRFALVVTIFVADRDAAGFSASSRDEHYVAVFRKNAGYLWGDETFLYLVPDSLPPLFAELRRHVDEYVVPFCRRCDSVDALVAVLDEENARLGENFFSSSLAVALARLGRLEQARHYFAQMREEPETIRAFAQHYGVTL